MTQCRCIELPAVVRPGDRFHVGAVAQPATASARGCRIKRVCPAGLNQLTSGMPQNFIESSRDQAFLLPPSLRDWLPGDHLAWFVIEAVDQIELSAFFAAYRSDGLGRAAYEPSMVALVLYAFATGERSSRGVEAHCRQDVAYRVIAGNQVPDQATIARFLRRHEHALSGPFGWVLALCARAGLVGSGVVAVDGTKVSGNANRDRSVDYDQIPSEIIAEGIATDAAEDEIYGDARGDELPPELATPEGRRAWLQRELARDAGQASDAGAGSEPQTHEFDLDQIVDRAQGRQGSTREARRQLERDRTQQARRVARSRSDRLRDGARRLEDELAAETRANRAYEAWKAEGRMRDGRRFGRAPNPWQAPAIPPGVVNLTDPDTRLMKGMRNYV
jgi:transposase